MADVSNTDSVEVWKPVPGWDGYEASSFGRVRSLDRVRVQRMRDGTMHPVVYRGVVRSQSQCPRTRYMKVGLSGLQDGRRKTCAVHKLVCEAFHSPSPIQGMQVAHGNGVRNDNAADNLRWATVSENRRDCIKHGTLNVGERNGSAKLTNEQFKEIERRRANGERVADLAAEFMLATSSIYQRLGRYRRKIGDGR